MINYLVLHLLFIVYAFNTMMGRMPLLWLDGLAQVCPAVRRAAAAGHLRHRMASQLKRFNLGVAYANRSSVVTWGILLAWLSLGEALSWTLALGAAMIIGGIILVSTEEDAS